MRVGPDPDDLATCVQCGLCLPHCPTWRVSGDEARSPRGRIALMRLLDGGMPPAADVVEALDTCVVCRGCEPACPSGVPFGRMMEATRAQLAGTPGLRYQPRWRRLAYRSLAHHRLVRAGGRIAALASRVPALRRRLGLPALPLRQPRLRATEGGGPEVWLVTGCVMDALQRHVHADTVEVLEAAGYRVRLPRRHEGCCGALAAHAGLLDLAADQARRLMAAFPGDAPIVVDSAGCGAHLKEHVGARVVDVCELLARDPARLAGPSEAQRPIVAVQDPCHLRHVQRCHLAVRAVLAPFADVVELDDEGLCCGAGGAYSLFHPEEAASIRERKLAAIARSGATTVVSANPGCQLHLAAAGLDVRHPVEVVAASVRGAPKSPSRRTS